MISTGRNWRVTQFVIFFVVFLYGIFQFYQGGTKDEGYGQSLCGPPLGYHVQINDEYPTIASYARKYEVKEWFIRTCNLTFRSDPHYAAHIVIPKWYTLYIWAGLFLIILAPDALKRILRR